MGTLKGDRGGNAGTWDAIVIGSGIGGLTAAALLARYGWRVLICEAYARPGGAAHGFDWQGFHFDTGPSFYCGLNDPKSCNPLRQVLAVLGESIATVAYDPVGYYHFPDATFPAFGNRDRYRQAIAEISPAGARQYAAFERRMLELYAGLRRVPSLALRSDWQGIFLLWRYAPALVQLLPQLGAIAGSVGEIAAETVADPWTRRLIDVECFLLSGLKAAGTIAPEMAFVLGERDACAIEYPVGGSRAIVAALVRALERWGGTLRTQARVERVLVKNGRVRGVRLKNGEELAAAIAISNATIWDTYDRLLAPEDLPAAARQRALQTPAVESFMHLHLGIRADGLADLTGHHAIVLDGDRDIADPGNTCMVSIPSVWDASLAPPGHHAVHAYTLESYAGWQRDAGYDRRKREKAETLYRALERVIPDIRDRVVAERIGTPLTHARYLNRYRGSYGPAIAAGTATFPGCRTEVRGLYRAGDSTVPGIGVPAVAASGILCANTLAAPHQTQALLDLLENS